MSFASLKFAFSLTCTLFHSFQSVTAKNRKEDIAVRTSYRKEVLALLSCSCKEVLVVSRTQAQATRNQLQEELLLADAKIISCACIIFGVYCRRDILWFLSMTLAQAPPPLRLKNFMPTVHKAQV